MITTILEIIIIVIGLILLQININKFLHVLQQSFYHNTEFIAVLRKTNSLKIDIFEIILTVTSIISMFIFEDTMYIFWIIFSIFAIYYTIIHKPKIKKKFVITTRVKTTYFAIYILIILLIILPYMLVKTQIIDKNIFNIVLVLSLNKYLAIFINMVANIIITPVLQLLNLRYINEAKNIIKTSKNLKVIGITGSYGKTSTKNIIYQILSQKFSTVMTPKSYNTTLGVVKSIRELVKPYTEVFICEMGAARIGEIQEICEIVPPDYSVITSIGPQHLSTFKSMRNIVQGKFEIVNYAKQDSVAILNIDNEDIKNNIEKQVNAKKIIGYSISDAKQKYHVENIHMNDKGSTFTVVCSDKKIDLETKLLGRHNIYNIVCSVAISKELGMTDIEIQKSVKKLRPIEHRLELKSMNGILALDDAFNSNPEGSKMAIECLCMFENKYKVLVTPGMIELGEQEYELNKKLGEYATKCDYVLLVGDKTTKPIKDGMDVLNYTNYEIVKDVYEAFDKLIKIKEKHPNLIALFENDLPDSYS
ncbi:MAG: UDP-N-acetylmuramoyl-tripeptide--D-alanyl-D-alanine ligase [Clostridia bacterium]|nr:UDP-N-acetylmuramoyl-tripeptide--D-alanyl-D-alanine ligase [Clostridia bacterium]MDD4386153.1 UDP-N-acetylmuramoyl-tripeptide--D-alanyl-D-alanine ligase [Clostridia bacterium]